MLDRDGFFDRRALRERALTFREAYARAEPFAHVVIDEFLPHASARELALEGGDPRIRHVLNELNGMAMLDFLATLTGVSGLIADPHFHGAGLHSTLRGGHLAMHADFSHDRFRNLARAITVMLYLPCAWEVAWGGALELAWDGATERANVVIDPLPNRLVVMQHGARHWHGHPKSLECPDGEARQAIAAGDGGSEDSPRGATWR